jgi:ubiquinone/menaquinone biosynthesis C-methylase UbiE
LDSQEYEVMYRVENHHWWYLGMMAITRTLLDRAYPSRTPLQIMDAGCGTGAAMAGFLAAYGKVTGVDISSLALEYCKSRQIRRLACASLESLPFASQSFDLITSFDVLYERSVTDDFPALKELARLLVPGGRLLVRLPAYNWLRGQHDEVVHTARRYTTRQVACLLRDCGFRIENLSYANTILFPFVLIKRILDKVFQSRHPTSDLSLNIGPFNNLFRILLSAEAPLVARIGLPYGSSVFALGQKIIP